MQISCIFRCGFRECVVKPLKTYVVSLAIKGQKFEIILTNRREIFVGHVAAVNVIIKGNKFE